MLNRIKQLFDAQMDVEHASSAPSCINKAVAALLIEVSRADYELTETERQSVISAVQQTFAASTEELDELISLAEAEVEKSISMYQFTQLVNEHYSYEQKLQLISGMWQVAFSDGELSKYEDHLIRRVADLIYVSHKDFIRLKLRQQDAPSSRH